MLTNADYTAISSQGRDPDEARHWLEVLAGPRRFCSLIRPAVVGDGLVDLPQDGSLEAYANRAAARGRVSSFVPASGAATRLASSLTPEALERLPHVASALGALDPSRLPKALVPVHDYGSSTRTALEEHLREAAALSISDQGTVRVHFTVGRDDVDRFREAAAQTRITGVDFQVGLSVQDPRTDTPYVRANGEVVRAGDGLAFRPGGHGALLSNLNALDADIVLVKNIDNVVVDRLREPVLRARRQLLGLAVSLQASLRRAREHGEEALRAWFLEHTGEQIADLDAAVARPLRVCGMVPNAGQPGGGPFWTMRGLQIVEGVEIDRGDASQAEILSASTHFNPVELVLCVRDLDGEPFDLMQFVDAERPLLADKRVGGVACRVVERPGLWNGGMSNWITVFAAVPACVFAPIKTAEDLFSEAHRAQ
ncbi:MAG: DUF4301 family protein [Proteobacteria bacterium]|nr:DUF4301 family protein [Pseudomonadota bacterium]